MRLMLRETGTRDEADRLHLRVPDLDAARAALGAACATLLKAPHVIHRYPDGTGARRAFLERHEGRPLAFHDVRAPAP